MCKVRVPQKQRLAGRERTMGFEVLSEAYLRPGALAQEHCPSGERGAQYSHSSEQWRFATAQLALLETSQGIHI